MAIAKKIAIFRVGDYVTIPHTPYSRGRIVESRGRIGPNRTEIFKVRISNGDGSTYIELRADQLEFPHEVTTLTFEQLAHRLRPVKDRGEPKDLSYPGPVIPFVPQTVTAEEFPENADPLDSDILLITAPAAVGKSTFAKALAAQAGTPFLDLAKVMVSTGSLSGILEGIGKDSPQEFRSGVFSLIVDAVDEGFLLSSEKPIEAFFSTTFEGLNGPAYRTGQGPKMLVFGRPKAIEIVATILALHAKELPVTRLTIDYFDEAQATKLALDFAERDGGAVVVQQKLAAIREAIRAFFKAIAASLNITQDRLWTDRRGRSFAGYAPVLAALGRLLGPDKDGKLPDLGKLKAQLEAGGSRKSWDVLEAVTREILDRESDKVRKPLIANFGDAIPPDVYNRIDQLDNLAAFVAGLNLPQPTRFSFGSPAAAVAYRDAVKSHLPDHPFQHEKSPVNDVLGALIVSHAIVRGLDYSGNKGSELLAEYGRKPFLWRFLRPRLEPETLIGGEVVAYILGSLQSDEATRDETTRSTTTEFRLADSEQDVAILHVRFGAMTESVNVTLPLILRGELRNLTVELTGKEVELAEWSKDESSVIQFSGRTTIRAKSIRCLVKHVQIGTLIDSSTCHLHAEDSIEDSRTKVVVQPGSDLIIEGVLKDRHPWNDSATVIQPPSDDHLGNLLADCEKRLQSVKSLVTFPNFDLTGDQRVDWAEDYGELLPRLLRALVEAGLASTRIIQNKEHTKMRVSPNTTWSVLRQGYLRPAQAEEKLRDVFKQLK